MSSPWDYFGASYFADAQYSLSGPVVAAAVPYPESRWNKVLAIIEQRWAVHIISAAAAPPWTLPDDPGDEISSDTDNDVPRLVPDTSSDEEGLPYDREEHFDTIGVLESHRFQAVDSHIHWQLQVEWARMMRWRVTHGLGPRFLPGGGSHTGMCLAIMREACRGPSSEHSVLLLAGSSSSSSLDVSDSGRRSW